MRSQWQVFFCEPVSSHFYVVSVPTVAAPNVKRDRGLKESTWMALRLLTQTYLLMKLMEKLIKKRSLYSRRRNCWIPFNLDQQRYGWCCHKLVLNFLCERLEGRKTHARPFISLTFYQLSKLSAHTCWLMRCCCIPLETKILWDGWYRLHD